MGRKIITKLGAVKKFICAIFIRKSPPPSFPRGGDFFSKEYLDGFNYAVNSQQILSKEFKLHLLERLLNLQKGDTMFFNTEAIRNMAREFRQYRWIPEDSPESIVSKFLAENNIKVKER